MHLALRKVSVFPESWHGHSAYFLILGRCERPLDYVYEWEPHSC